MRQTTLKYLAIKLSDAAVYLVAGGVHSGYALVKTLAAESLDLYRAH